MKSYSKLELSTTTEYKWHGLPQTDRTKKERAKVKALLDDFTSFEWRGVNAWDTFGAFIVNERNSLKFFNGPTWSNEYSKPQFSSQSNQLTGMSFKTPSFGFTMGVYWFSDQDYRFLLDWLNPYEINSLSFGYDKGHYYQVKLASISQGTRYFLGKETIIEDNGARTENKYYTEISLVFEIQGDNCAYNKDAFLIPNSQKEISWTPKGIGGYSITLPVSEINSDLDTPIEAQLNFTLKKYKPMDVYKIGFYMCLERSNIQSYIPPQPWQYYHDLYTNKIFVWNGKDWDYSQGVNLPDWKEVTIGEPGNDFITLSMAYKNQYYELFSFDLQNLPYESGLTLNIKYTSEDGLVFWSQGESRFRLLSSLSTLSTGYRLLRDINTNIMKIPGHFNIIYEDNQDIQFIITQKEDSLLDFDTNSSYIQVRGRTNVI